MSKVRFRELAPREGFQGLPTVYPTELKLEFIEHVTSTGVFEIEVCSFVRPDRLPQMADAEQIASSLPTFDGSFTGLYLNRAGLKRARSCSKLVMAGWIHIAASDKFLQANSNTTLDQVIAQLPEWQEIFAQEQVAFHGLIFSTAFG